MNLHKELSTWDKHSLVKFAVWCAKRCQRLSDNPDVTKCIQLAEKWLREPTEKNAKMTRIVASRLYCDNYADKVAYYAASTTSWVIDITSACCATHYAASALNTTETELFNSYLRELAEGALLPPTE